MAMSSGAHFFGLIYASVPRLAILSVCSVLQSRMRPDLCREMMIVAGGMNLPNREKSHTHRRHPLASCKWMAPPTYSLQTSITHPFYQLQPPSRSSDREWRPVHGSIGRSPRPDLCQNLTQEPQSALASFALPQRDMILDPSQS